MAKVEGQGGIAQTSTLLSVANYSTTVPVFLMAATLENAAMIYIQKCAQCLSLVTYAKTHNVDSTTLKVQSSVHHH